jgi:hypothetical protein
MVTESLNTLLSVDKPMDSECCVQKAARLVGRIVVNGQSVGVSKLSKVLEEAHVSGLEGDALREELLRLASKHNYIAPAVREAYGQGLMKALQSYRDSAPAMVRIDQK